MQSFRFVFSVLFLLLLILSASCFHLKVSKKLTVSGISSGGYMANQFQVAHSKIVSGAGIVSAGPYYCSMEGYYTLATTSCMLLPELIEVGILIDSMISFEIALWIDPLSHLKKHKVFLYSGTNDSVVVDGVTKKLSEQYARLGVTDVVYVNNIPSEHSFVTDDYGNACDYKGIPYLNNCEYDLAGEMLAQIHGINSSKTESKAENIFKFSQLKYLGISTGEYGYSYVPESCQNGEECSLHLALHGCEQCHHMIGMKFVENAGYNEWAESNNIIVIYPQTTVNDLLNPLACWDFWGYAGVNYPIKIGNQIHMLKSIIDDFQSGKIKLERV